MNIKHIITLIIAMVLSAGNIISQVSYVDTPVFKVGEKATYGIYFNLGFISMKALFSVSAEMVCDLGQRFLVQSCIIGGSFEGLYHNLGRRLRSTQRKR